MGMCRHYPVGDKKLTAKAQNHKTWGNFWRNIPRSVVSACKTIKQQGTYFYIRTGWAYFSWEKNWCGWKWRKKRKNRSKKIPEKWKIYLHQFSVFFHQKIMNINSARIFEVGCVLYHLATHQNSHRVRRLLSQVLKVGCSDKWNNVHWGLNCHCFSMILA